MENIGLKACFDVTFSQNFIVRQTSTSKSSKIWADFRVRSGAGGVGGRGGVSRTQAELHDRSGGLRGI